MALQDKTKWIEYSLLFSSLLFRLLYRGEKSMSPQGSAMSSFLFSIFTDDLEQGLCNQMFKFADDAEVFQAVKSDTDDKKPHEYFTEQKY